eukprot:1840308-Rhodomonas_salina.1
MKEEMESEEEGIVEKSKRKRKREEDHRAARQGRVRRHESCDEDKDEDQRRVQEKPEREPPPMPKFHPKISDSVFSFLHHHFLSGRPQPRAVSGRGVVEKRDFVELRWRRCNTLKVCCGIVLPNLRAGEVDVVAG